MDDSIPEERALGIYASQEWYSKATNVCVYTDLGISSGMKEGIKVAQFFNKPIDYQVLGYRLYKKIRKLEK